MTRETHPTASREDWLAARRALLEDEKALTRAGDALAARRRALPWVRIEEPYAFDAPDGEKTLADLFDGRGQLMVQHFMFGADWAEGCPSCSFWIDGYNGLEPHLAARDLTLVAAATAPIETLEAYRRRMGWSVPFVSSGRSRFNQDFGVTFGPEGGEINFGTGRFSGPEAPGVSFFVRLEDGGVAHAYSAYARGLDILNGAYRILDAAPRGRDEDGLAFTMAWLRRRDEYEA